MKQVFQIIKQQEAQDYDLLEKGEITPDFCSRHFLDCGFWRVSTAENGAAVSWGDRVWGCQNL